MKPRFDGSRDDVSEAVLQALLARHEMEMGRLAREDRRARLRAVIAPPLTASVWSLAGLLGRKFRDERAEGNNGLETNRMVEEAKAKATRA